VPFDDAAGKDEADVAELAGEALLVSVLSGCEFRCGHRSIVAQGSTIVNLSVYRLKGMLVHRVVIPVTEAVSWTVLGDDGEPVAPVESYLSHLAAVERSPETVRAYAFGLKAFFEFLAANAVAWDAARVEDVGRFVAWLRAPASNVIVLDVGTARRSPATVNRYLAAVFGFYDFHARSGVGVGSQLVAWRRSNRGGYKPLLHGIGKARAVPTRPIGLVVPTRVPRTLQPDQVAAILAACTHLRDRLLIGLLAETGMRVGQALGLRHSDFVTRELAIHIVPRVDNANGARTKTRAVATIPISVPFRANTSAPAAQPAGRRPRPGSARPSRPRGAAQAPPRWRSRC
jgi:integrase/recombinase XerD